MERTVKAVILVLVLIGASSAVWAVADNQSSLAVLLGMSYTPTISASTSAVKDGDTFTITGWGFAPCHWISINAILNGNPQYGGYLGLAPLSDINGNIPAQVFYVPHLNPSGTIYVQSLDQGVDMRSSPSPTFVCLGDQRDVPKSGPSNLLAITYTGTTPPPPPNTYDLTVWVTDEQAMTIGGATVTLSNGQSKTTAPYGQVIFTSLVSGTYTIIISKTGYLNKQMSITLTSSQLVTIALTSTIPPPPPDTETTVYVLDSANNGAPISGASVRIDGGPAQTSNLQGQAFFSNIAEDWHSITVEKLGYETRTVNVIAGPSYSISISMAATPVVTATYFVVDATGHEIPIPSATSMRVFSPVTFKVTVASASVSAARVIIDGTTEEMNSAGGGSYISDPIPLNLGTHTIKFEYQTMANTWTPLALLSISGSRPLLSISNAEMYVVALVVIIVLVAITIVVWKQRQ